MLFDLRGRGRRRTVQAVYLGLALLMGGGLVLLGVGGAGSGGLLDAFTGSSGSSKTNNSVFNDKIKAAEKRIQVNRKDAGAWAELARNRYQLGVDDSNIDVDEEAQTAELKPEGRAELQQADHAWQEYLKLVPENPDPNTAAIMVNAYQALEDLPKAASTQEIIAESRNDVGSYLQWARYAYAAKQQRTGELAGQKAIALATKDQKDAIKSQVQQLQQAALQDAISGATGTTGATPDVPLTPGAG